MGEVKGNGHDPVTLEMVQLLRAIVERVDRTNAELHGFRSEFLAFKTEVRGELTEIRGELREIHHEIADTNVRVSLTNEKLEELRDEVRGTQSGLATQQDHAARIVRLEEAVFKRTGS